MSSSNDRHKYSSGYSASGGESNMRDMNARVIAEAMPIIDAVNEDWWPAMEARDAKRAAAAYADDGVLITLDGAAYVGRQAIEVMLAERFAQGGAIASIQHHMDGLHHADGYIHEWGRGDITIDNGGRSQVISRRYITVWRREPENAWRIVRNMVF